MKTSYTPMELCSATVLVYTGTCIIILYIIIPCFIFQTHTLSRLTVTHSLSTCSYCTNGNVTCDDQCGPGIHILLTRTTTTYCVRSCDDCFSPHSVQTAISTVPYILTMRPSLLVMDATIGMQSKLQNSQIAISVYMQHTVHTDLYVCHAGQHAMHTGQTLLQLSPHSTCANGRVTCTRQACLPGMM